MPVCKSTFPIITQNNASKLYFILASVSDPTKPKKKAKQKKPRDRGLHIQHSSKRSAKMKTDTLRPWFPADGAKV